ncbi:H-NS histone family protein [Burkholderia cenocepacia]|nr:H-NS histone family protein [Burkholderia cenocepacia]
MSRIGWTSRRRKRLQIFGRRRAVAAHPRAPIAPKYRDPKTGATWSGRGKAPQWIAKAKNRDRFPIEQ